MPIFSHALSFQMPESLWQRPCINPPHSGGLLGPCEECCPGYIFEGLLSLLKHVVIRSLPFARYFVTLKLPQQWMRATSDPFSMEATFRTSHHRVFLDWQDSVSSLHCWLLECTACVRRFRCRSGYREHGLPHSQVKSVFIELPKIC